MKKFEDVYGDQLVFTGSLDLRGTGITSLPDNLTVGGWLDLRGTGITSLPDNLTVGGSLDLQGTGITSLPDNLTVGGWLDLRGTGITQEQEERVNRNVPAVLSWRGGRYISADGIFCEVISRKGGVHKCKKINSNDGFYIVSVDGKTAHGKTIKEARADLLYKIANRDTTKYIGMKKTDSLTHAEAIEMYRVITGACSFGTKDFVENRLPKKKARYTIAEVIKTTKGEYGNAALVEFFG